jgi:hypothetical protein
MITEFSLAEVAPHPQRQGRGGITSRDSLAQPFMGCGDSPDENGRAQAGLSHLDVPTGLVVEVTRVEPAGRSGRRWLGVRCALRVSDARARELYVELDAEVPAFNVPSALLREGPSMAFLSLTFNGYPRETRGRGNKVVALDLCAHKVAWQSKDMVANADLLLDGEYLMTGYGFTAEKDFLYLLDRATGQVVQQVAVPKAPEELRLQDGQLFARIYDGYAVVPLMK